MVRMHKFSLYETVSKFYLVGGDMRDRTFHMLKIDRMDEVGKLIVQEDETTYSKDEVQDILRAIEEESKVSGGLKLRCNSWGFLGFIKFTGAFYILLITKRSQIAVLGGHFIYQIDDTSLISILSPLLTRTAQLDSEEHRHISILNNVDLSRSFYFCYTYDITRTLQANITEERQRLNDPRPVDPKNNSMFVWNHHLLSPAREALRDASKWCIPIVHGFIDQASISVFGRVVHMTIIARRSRFFAGARFLKRGVNDCGYVANDVETEQVVCEMQSTSFHAPGCHDFSNSNITSYVQHRGSIPLYWSQDSSGVSPKPDIKLDRVDPFYTATGLHFDNLFKRYGSPIYVLNLVKARESVPRESILLREYSEAINYLNQNLPAESQIRYKAWDMSRASQSRDQDVISTLETIAEDVMQSTGFFHNGRPGYDPMQMQNGVTRTNCIDCLDRTNAAQFVIGKRALGHQLHALGILRDTSIEYETYAINLFMQIFHSHGDTIAVQYGGSHLVNTMETYRKVKQWSSSSRDMVESFKRYYNNSFLDKQRQEAYNLFLGNYTYSPRAPLLWELSSDYYLHHAHPRQWAANRKGNYKNWATPDNLKFRVMQVSDPQNLPKQHIQCTPVTSKESDDYWFEYYKPYTISSFAKMFAVKLNSTQRYHAGKSKEYRTDASPFDVRERSHEKGNGHQKSSEVLAQEGPKQREEIKSTGDALQQWLRLQHQQSGHSPNIVDSKAPQAPNIKYSGDINVGAQGKAAAALQTLDHIHYHSLHPVVTEAEAREYERYVNHPLQLPLVISDELPLSPDEGLTNYVFHLVQKATDSSVDNAEDIVDLTDFLDISQKDLTLNDLDISRKRYKAYRQWVKGKPLFTHRLESDTLHV